MPSVRLISGRFGGRKIEAPASDNRRIHPMGERIRNAIFNSLGGRVTDASILDAFAGTGAIGFEALSRGAREVTFLEKDRIAQKIISSNIHTLGVESQSKLIKTSVSKWSDTYSGTGFQLVFADPPYYDTQNASVARLTSFVAKDGMMIVSWPEKYTAPHLDNMEMIDERIYAGARILFYEPR